MARRGPRRIDALEQMALKREREERRRLLWHDASEYYDSWTRRNVKHDEWTSPRYYEANGRMIRERETKREKEERLECRRERLRRLLREEEESEKIETTLRRSKGSEKESKGSEKVPVVPVEVLREINTEKKEREEERRRYEAEMKLYRQWRTNNPIVRQYESRFRHRDLKLSWLDQQIEKRMRKEKEEEENKRLVEEQEELQRKQLEEQETFERYLREKRSQLKSYLDRQVQELQTRSDEENQLNRSYLEERSKLARLEELEETLRTQEKRRTERSNALYNIRQYKMKLKTRARDVEESLRLDELTITKLRELRLEEMLQDESERRRIKTELDTFSDLIGRQRRLEKERESHLQFLFDSEAKSVYERQSSRWFEEERARRSLVAEVLESVKRQIEEKIKSEESKREEVKREREELERKAREYKVELDRLREEEERRKREVKIELDVEVRAKKAREKLEESRKIREINDELDRIRKEEERLEEEIARIQIGQRPTATRHHRASTRFF